MPSRPPSDLTQNGLTLLVGLLNMKEKSGTRVLSTSDVTLGVPSATPDGSLKNTQVDVTATAGCLYQGSLTITYDRLDLATVIGKKLGTTVSDAAPLPVTTTAGTLTSIGQLVSALFSDPANPFGITMDASDFIDGPLDTTVLPVNVSIVAAAGSLRYINHLPVHLTA